MPGSVAMSRPPLRLSMSGAAALAFLVFFAAAAVSAQPPPGAANADTMAGQLAVPDSAAAGPPTMFGAEVAAALAAEAERVEELLARFGSQTDAAAALDIQREIERVKAETEIEILHIQARHARAAGRGVDAERIEAAAQRLAEPPPVRQPAPRPAPGQRPDTNAR